MIIRHTCSPANHSADGWGNLFFRTLTQERKGETRDNKKKVARRGPRERYTLYGRAAKYKLNARRHRRGTSARTERERGGGGGGGERARRRRSEQAAAKREGEYIDAAAVDIYVMRACE